MKIKLAIIESDDTYLSRLSKVLNSKYSSKLQVSYFSDYEIATEYCNNNKFDMVILDESVDASKFEKSNVVILANEIGVSKFGNQKAISKYQKASSIYSEILKLYSEFANDRDFSSNNEQKESKSTDVISFTSFSGGVGTTSVSVATAEHFASRGYNVVYLSTGLFADPSMYFHNDGPQNFSNAIYAIKSKKNNLSLKIESSLSSSFSGVSYFASPNMSIDVSEMASEDWVKLIDELINNFDFDFIIIDIDNSFDFSQKNISILDKSDKIVVVNDGSVASNRKFEMAYNSLYVFEENKDYSLIEKMYLVYNKFSNKTSLELSNINIKCIGGIQRVESNSVNNSIKFIKEYSGIFEKLI